MSKKKIWLTILLVVLAMMLAACGGQTAADDGGGEETGGEETGGEDAGGEETGGEEATDEPLTFGLILVGPRNDRGWSQAHYEGGLFVEENMDAEMIVFESLNPADKPEASVESVSEEMIAQGAEVIFTTSDEFEEDTLTVAEQHPDVTFINISGDDAWEEGREFQAPANESNLMGRMEDMKAIAGCAAAMATETGQIGYLGPLINFETRRLTASAYLGARYCYEEYRGLNPDDLQFEVVWIGFWFNIPGVTLDPTEVANQFFDGGKDVIISGIDTTEAIVVSGQRAAEGERVFAVPYDFEGACEEAPDICLGVPYFNWGPDYLEALQTIQAGDYEQFFTWSEPYWEDLTDNSQTPVGWIDGPGLTSNEEWNSAVDSFTDGLASGDVTVWEGPINLQDGSAYIEEGEAATDQQIWYLPQLLEGMEGASE